MDDRAPYDPTDKDSALPESPLAEADASAFSEPEGNSPPAAGEGAAKASPGAALPSLAPPSPAGPSLAGPTLACSSLAGASLASPTLASPNPAIPSAGLAPAPAPVHKDQPLFGMACAAGAFLMLSTMSLLAKLLSARHGVIEIAFWRNLVGVLPFLVLILAFRRREILKVKSKPGVVLTRSVIAAASVMCLFGAFAYLPMADATALIFTSALFVPLLGFFFLGERVGIYRWSAIMAGFVGVLVIAQPTGGWNLTGAIFAVSAAVLNAVLSTMLRLLGRTERQDTLTFYLLLTGALLLAPLMPFVATWPTPREIPLIIAIGLSGVCMQLLLSTAFKYTPAALAAVFSYTQIIWATLFGFLIFGDVPAWNIIAGAAIIVAASVFVVLRENYLARRGQLPRAPGPAPE